MKVLKLKNYFFYGGNGGFTLQSFLNSLMLHGKETRERTRFLNIIAPRVQEVEAERLRIARINAKQDKKGNILFLDKDGKETTDEKLGLKFTIADEGKFTKELSDYLGESLVIDIVPSVGDTIETVKRIILGSNKDLTGVEANEYDEWCQAFENIKEEK